MVTNCVVGNNINTIQVMLNKNTWGVKKCGPIRSNIANRQVRPKGLISAEAKKLLYQIIVTP